MKHNSLLLASVAAVVFAGMAMSSFGQTGEVYSLNVVGFQKLSATAGLTMVSTPFQRDATTIDDVVGGQLTGTKSADSADQVIMWVATNQSYAKFWLKSTDMKWYTYGALPVRATNASVIPEMGFWIRNRQSTGETVVVSGNVVDDGAATNALLPGLNMVSYPFSTSIDINQSKLTNGTATKSADSADQIILWNPASQSYDKYWLKTDRRWWTYGAIPVVSSNIMIGGGRGFWYRNKATTNFVWIETKPYTL